MKINFVHILPNEISMGSLQSNMLTPRPYLSWSSMHLLETSEEAWLQHYVYGKKIPINKGMAFGSIMAENLETDGSSGDAMLDIVMVKLPKLELRDVSFEVALKNGKDSVPLIIKPDSASEDYSAFYEYKTGKKRWTKSAVDTFGQLTFYATGMYLKTGRVPKDIRLIHVMTEDHFGDIRATGEIFEHRTERTMLDILSMMIRMKRAWKRIGEISTESFF